MDERFELFETSLGGHKRGGKPGAINAALLATSILAIFGECSGKIRSTFTPKEFFLTVNVSLIPPPLREIHRPSKTCTRSRLPSMTL